METRSDKAGGCAVHSVHEFVFSVPDLAQAVHFYDSFGLDTRMEDGALALYTKGNPHRWGRIYPGPEKSLLWLTLGIFADEVAAFEARFAALGIERIAAPPGADPAGIWISAPDGLPLCLLVAPKTSPSASPVRTFTPESGSAGRAPRRSELRKVHPRHLSHILLFTPDVGVGIDFYSRVLGLRLSDRSGDIVAFLHSPHGSDHHLVAFAKSHSYGLHHSSWDVASFDDIGAGTQQMTEAGYPHGWGIGRHVLGSNYFRYVRDPWGSYAEYSFDIDFIPPTLEWAAGDYAPEDSLYVWGPVVPAEFIENHERHGV
ncbi:MAG: VOC family protein [Pseudomonadota bacterium]